MNERKNDDEKKKQFEKLMKEIRRDPEKGLRRLYDAYAKIMQTTAQVICRSTDKANEVVNDVLVKIWKLAEKIEDIDNPEGWIYVITANTAKDSLRERNSFPLEEDIAASKDAIQEVLDRNSFYWMIQDLSEIEQAIMIHKFVSGCTFQEIAEVLEKPMTTVTSTYYRALDKIKKNVEGKL